MKLIKKELPRNKEQSLTFRFLANSRLPLQLRLCVDISKYKPKRRNTDCLAVYKPQLYVPSLWKSNVV